MKHTSIYSLSKYRLDEVEKKILSFLEEIEEEEDIRITLTREDIRVILETFYRYYERKKIGYLFAEGMIGHFRDMALDAIEYSMDLDLAFVLGELQLYELLDSPLAVLPRDTKRMVKQIEKKLKPRR